MRLTCCKHNNLMLRSEQRERLEAWAAATHRFHTSVLLGPSAAALLARQPIRQRRGLFCRLLPDLRWRWPFSPPRAVRRLRGRAARLSASPCCRARLSSSRRGRSFRPWHRCRARALLKRASARSRSSFASQVVFFFFGLALAFGLRRVGEVGGFPRQSRGAQVGGSLPDRDVGRRDIGHRLDAFGILGGPAVQPDLLQLGGRLRFVIHLDCLKLSRRASWSAPCRPHLTMHRRGRGQC